MVIYGLSFHSEWLIISWLHEIVTLWVLKPCCWCFYDRTGSCRVFIHFEIFFFFVIFFIFLLKDLGSLFLLLMYTKVSGVTWKACGQTVREWRRVKIIFESLFSWTSSGQESWLSVHALFQQHPASPSLTFRLALAQLNQSAAGFWAASLEQLGALCLPQGHICCFSFSNITLN